MGLEKECRQSQDAEFWRRGGKKEGKNSLRKKILPLRSNRDFKRAYNRGQRISGAHLVVCVMWNKLNLTRLGVTASKKVGCAVQRNRARRIIKEAFRNLDFFVKKDIVVVAKPSILGLKMQDVSFELAGLLSKSMKFK